MDLLLVSVKNKDNRVISPDRKAQTHYINITDTDDISSQSIWNIPGRYAYVSPCPHTSVSAPRYSHRNVNIYQEFQDTVEEIGEANVLSG